MSLRTQLRYLNPFELHKLLINEYVLKHPGDTSKLKRDTSKDKTDFDVLRENHKFLWDSPEGPKSWEQQFAKKYYDKLFKEYCIGDLTFYKQNKIALRWRIEREVVIGKGQFICGNKKCNKDEGLRTWEVNFSYSEDNVKKNALVKIRLCPDCSVKLNYHSKKREVKRLDRKKFKRKSKETKTQETSEVKEPKPCGSVEASAEPETDFMEESDETPWDKHKPEEIKSRDEEMEEYLQDLLL